MDAIKVLVVEDKMLVASAIAAALEKHGLQVTGICRSGDQALSQLDKEQPDLILMDIELDGPLDGIATSELINRRLPVPIIYLSDYTDDRTVDRAKKTFPANYLSKPFNEAELIRAIDIAFTNYNARIGTPEGTLLGDHVFVRTNSQAYQKVAYSDIFYLKAGGSYCQIFMEDKTLTLSNSMNNIHQQLNHKDFMRVHRSFVVNVKKITFIEGRVIHLGKHRVQMNEESHKELLTRLKLVK